MLPISKKVNLLPAMPRLVFARRANARLLSHASPSVGLTITPITAQKPKHGSGKKKSASESAPSELTPLAAFFATHVPRFKYNPTASASREFYRLCDTFGWNRGNPERHCAYEKFKDALVQEFNHLYGTDPDSLTNWQNLCYVVRVDPVPDDLHACREASPRSPFRPFYLAAPVAHLALPWPRVPPDGTSESCSTQPDFIFGLLAGRS